MQLHLLILGCKPLHRHTEQHDVFFGIGNSLKDLLPQIQNFWPDAGKIHIDSWRQITNVDGYQIKIVEKNTVTSTPTNKLFFLNLGGYKPNDMEEYHYKLLVVAKDKGKAVTKAKQTAFYKHTGFGKVATSHIDDKYGVDVDDIYEIEDILPEDLKEKYTIQILPSTTPLHEDELHIGYLKLSAIK